MVKCHRNSTVILPRPNLRVCAILTRRWEDLDPLRALLEAEGIPVSRVADARFRPPPFAIRENRQLLDRLRQRRGESVSVAQLISWLNDPSLPGGRGFSRSVEDDTPAKASTPAIAPQTNPWRTQLLRLIDQWREEAGDAPQPVARFEEFLCEALAEQRHDQRLGEGIFLSTAHAAKGMEFDHLWLLDGGWQAGNPKDREAERSLYYVALSRARQTLCILRRADCANPFAGTLEGEFLLDRHAPHDRTYPEQLKGLKYDLIGQADLFLSYAGRHTPNHPIHRALAELQPGSLLRAVPRGGHIQLLTADNVPIAQLAKGKRIGGEESGQLKWESRLEGIEQLRVIAMIRRDGSRENGEYRERCQVESWELPLVEVAYRNS